jgi:hypothetical protein
LAELENIFRVVFGNFIGMKGRYLGWMLGVMLLMAWGLGGQLLAQQTNRMASFSMTYPTPAANLRIPTLSHRLIPKTIKDNPMGLSPLCRMELKIERQSPVGVWLRLDGNRFQEPVQPGWASMRLKLPLRSL